ncbi:MAG: hypothetical protein M0Z27_11185 [Thermaerobacter sp.]|nr:hypothetical protein [Thermaerobacter sp.]
MIPKGTTTAAMRSVAGLLTRRFTSPGSPARDVEDATGIPVRKVRVTAYGAPKEA